jgi:hypothetical protein
MNALAELIGEDGEIIDCDELTCVSIQDTSKYPNHSIHINFEEGIIKIFTFEGEVIETKKFKYILV